MPRFYCADCNVVQVAEQHEYCDGCIQDIIDYLEKDDTRYYNELAAKQHDIDYGLKVRWNS